MTLFVYPLLANNSAQRAGNDPYSRKGLTPLEFQGKDPSLAHASLSICYEVFSLPLAEAAELRRQRISDPELYQRMVDGLKNKTITQETFTVLRSRSGENTASRAISEYLYPTEFESAAIPNSVSVSFASPQVEGKPAPLVDTEKLKDAAPLNSVTGLHTSANPANFETRHTGATTQCEATILNKLMVNLSMSNEHVELAGYTKWGQGASLVKKPLFETQKAHLHTTVRVDKPFLIGTMNRTPNSTLHPDSANKVLYAFVTISLAKP